MRDNPELTRVTAWRLFLTAQARLVELIEGELAQAGLPPLGWYDVLFALEEAPKRRLRMHELSRAVVLSRSNLTRLVDRLEAAGLLRREPCPTDRRGAFAVLTPEGAQMRRRMWPVYADCIQRHFANHLGKAEAKVFIEVFERVLAAADA
jgi:DNA-binding MarR family transcriptional regulator